MTAPRVFVAGSEEAGRRLDQFLVAHVDAEIGGVSRSRIQLLIEQGGVLVDDGRAKPSHKLRGGERITVTGEAQPAPLKAIPEAIPLEVVYEDNDLAVVNKPAGMMVHAGSGATDDARSRGTLVNALLHRFRSLSSTGGELRPGIVHRLDKSTSGLIVVAKNDRAHAALAASFSGRRIRKTYIALVDGSVARGHGTITAAVSRDTVRRTRMTTKPNQNARTAVTHYQVVERLDTRFGKFTLLSVQIETGRTHQIRVHMASIGHPVVGDTLYGAAAELRDAGAARLASRKAQANAQEEVLCLGRNFLHAAKLEFAHPLTAKPLEFEAPLPPELAAFLKQLQERSTSTGPGDAQGSSTKVPARRKTAPLLK